MGLRHLFQRKLKEPTNRIEREKLLKQINQMADKKVNWLYYLGKAAGLEEGLKLAEERKITRSRELSAAEEGELVEFLINRDLELCYDSSICGFRVRKTNFGWKEKGITYKFIDPCK